MTLQETYIVENKLIKLQRAVIKPLYSFFSSTNKSKDLVHCIKSRLEQDVVENKKNIEGVSIYEMYYYKYTFVAEIVMVYGTAYLIDFHTKTSLEDVKLDYVNIIENKKEVIDVLFNNNSEDKPVAVNMDNYLNSKYRKYNII